MKKKWLEGVVWVASGYSFDAINTLDVSAIHVELTEANAPLVKEKRVRWIFELKEAGPKNEMLVEKALSVAPEGACFMSESVDILDRLAGYPVIAKALDIDQVRSLLKLDVRSMAIEKSCLDPYLIDQLISNRIKIYSFNIQTKQELFKMIYLGVDGIMSSNIEYLKQEAEKSYEEIDSPQLLEWIERGEVTLVDVREMVEYEKEHLKDAVLMPMKSFAPSHLVVPVEKKLVFYCQVGTRSAYAAKAYLAAKGDRTCYNLKGGLVSWKSYQYPLIH